MFLHDDRIFVDPVPASKGSTVKIGYNGLLAKSGADAVWIHYGFDGWNSTATVPMYRQADGSFVTHITAQGNKEINFCFKDSADHWDNNSGWNWMCPIK
ncbi:carbohydrate-binding protein [Calderihabitans maritimus]|uniref:Carbohydrate binding module family 25 domain-containing protein n=1 Tax=Calderihabitans maritimus TaxID=1246530 RepID=A0A1Z5HQZ5_9FIRM|nr:carbohydrate-binding protein [Calderihabitans maritimus]GAW91735.1 hypothetical protein Adeg_1051 [Calderihabitans maritimus]